MPIFFHFPIGLLYDLCNPMYSHTQVKKRKVDL